MSVKQDSHQKLFEILKRKEEDVNALSAWNGEWTSNLLAYAMDQSLGRDWWGNIDFLFRKMNEWRKWELQSNEKKKQSQKSAQKLVNNIIPRIFWGACRRGREEEMKKYFDALKLRAKEDHDGYLGMGDNEEVFNQGLKMTVKNGRLDMVKWLDEEIEKLENEGGGYRKVKKEVTSTIFELACQAGHGHVVEYFLEDSGKMRRAGIHEENQKGFNGFVQACSCGHLNVIKQLIRSPVIKSLDWSLSEGNHAGFRLACQNGHLEVVRYLLTSQEILDHGYSWADVHACEEDGLLKACAHGHWDVMKYLLTSTELKEAGHTFANLHAQKEQALINAAEEGISDVIIWEEGETIRGDSKDGEGLDEKGQPISFCAVKYLLTSKELVEAGHAWATSERPEKESTLWETVCGGGNLNLARWLLFSKEIQKNKGFKVDVMKEWVPAIEWASEYGEISMVRWLLGEEVKKHESVRHENWDKMHHEGVMGVLKNAVREENKELIKMMFMEEHVNPMNPEVQKWVQEEAGGLTQEYWKVALEKKELGETLNQEGCRQNQKDMNTKKAKKL